MSKSTGAVKFYLKDPKSLSTSPIKVVFCYNQLQFTYYERKLSVIPKQWDKRNQSVKCPPGYPENKKINWKLNSIRSAILESYHSFKNQNRREPKLEELRMLVNKELGKNQITPTKQDSFFDFIENYLEQSSNRLNINTGKQISAVTIRTYQQTLNLLREFETQSSITIDFATLSIFIYNEFTNFLLKEKKFKVNTTGKHQRNLKTFWKQAFDEKLTENRDFEKRVFKVISETVDNVSLSMEELLLIEKLDLSGNKRLDAVRDLFIVACWTGLRFSDFSILKPHHLIEKNDIKYIEIETQKTGGKVTIPLTPQVQAVFKKYQALNGNLIPKSYSNQKMNRYIKEFCQLIPELNEPFITTNLLEGKKKVETTPKYLLLSTHTGRRSFATNFSLMGANNQMIMKITGHKTEKSFNKYLNLQPKDAADILIKIYKDSASTVNNIKA